LNPSRVVLDYQLGSVRLYALRLYATEGRVAFGEHRPALPLLLDERLRARGEAEAARLQ
jgi:hypothetical protein